VGLHVDTTAHFVTLPPIIGEQRIVMSVFVCLSIFMSVCEHISETTRPISADFFCTYNTIQTFVKRHVAWLQRRWRTGQLI